MKKCITSFLLLICFICKSQITVRQLIKLKEIPMTEMTNSIKDYGFVLHDIKDITTRYVNDNKILKDAGMLTISPNTLYSEKPKVIQYVTPKDDFFKYFRIQLTNLGFNYLQTRDALGKVWEVYKNNLNETISLNFDEKTGLRLVLYINSNE